MDITKRKRAEMESHRLGLYLKSILDHAPFAVMATDTRGIIDFFNASAEKMLGYSRAEVVGQLTPLHFHVAEEVRSRTQPHAPAEMPGVVPEFAPFLSLLCPGAARLEDWHLTSKEGEVIQAQARFSAIVDEEGRILGYLEVAEDVSEKRRLEAEKGLYQRMSALGQLAAGIAHEINTPMQFISDNVAFFQDNFFNLLKAFDALARKGAQENACVSGDEIREIFERADYEYTKLEIPKAIKQTIDGAARVNEIVGSLKNLSHMDSPERVSVDCNRLLNDALVVTRNVWKKAADAVEAFDAELPLVEAIPGELSQVIINLIMNAVYAMQAKALPEKGVLTLRTRQADAATIELSVSDTGIGIPPGAQERVFEPFFTTKPFGQGTGQGLFLARKIVVEKHQGKLFFATSPQGTTFFVQLPHKHAKPALKTEPVLAH
jgi:signal transduction histidine kinase